MKHVYTYKSAALILVYLFFMLVPQQAPTF